MKTPVFQSFSLPFSEVGFSRLLFCSVSSSYAMVAAKKTVRGPSTPVCLFVCFSRFNCVSSPCTYFSSFSFSFSFSVHSFFYISRCAVWRISFPSTMQCLFGFCFAKIDTFSLKDRQDLGLMIFGHIVYSFSVHFFVFFLLESSFESWKGNKLLILFQL